MRNERRFWVRPCRVGCVIKVFQYQDRELQKPHYRCRSWLRRAHILRGEV